MTCESYQPFIVDMLRHVRNEIYQQRKGTTLMFKKYIVNVIRIDACKIRANLVCKCYA